MARFVRGRMDAGTSVTARGGSMDRNQKDRSGQFDQTQQRDKLQGAGKEGVDPSEKSRQQQQKQGGSQQGGSQQGGSKQGGSQQGGSKQGGGQQGGQGFERDVPRRGNEDPNIDRQTGTNPGRTGDQGMGQSGSPRQTGVGETGRTGSSGPE